MLSPRRLPLRLRSLFVLSLTLAFLGSDAANAQTTSVVISGKANIFGANRPSNPTPAPAGGGGGVAAPFQTFSSANNLVLTFSSVTGTVSCCDPGNTFLTGGGRKRFIYEE